MIKFVFFINMIRREREFKKKKKEKEGFIFYSLDFIVISI